MHYQSEEDKDWLIETVGRYDPYFNGEHLNRFGLIFSDKLTSTNKLWLGISVRGDKLTVVGAATHPSIRNTGYLKEIGIDAIAWLERDNLWNVSKLIIPVKEQYDCLYNGFFIGTTCDGMRSDIKVVK